MKTRSKALYTYLLNSGALHGTEEDIACAKREYRRLYKKQWKQGVRPRKEIRVGVTLKQLAEIKVKAAGVGLPYTTYARRVILAATGAAQGIPDVGALLQVLQVVSMACIASARNTTSTRALSEQLQWAENLLLHYIRRNEQ